MKAWAKERLENYQEALSLAFAVGQFTSILSSLWWSFSSVVSLRRIAISLCQTRRVALPQMQW